MRLGLFGGSFNPPHIGHLLVAVDACEALGLDKLIIMPAAANPLKAKALGGTSPAQRLEMTRLAFAADSRFEVSDMEIGRGGLSYTVDTLEELARNYEGAELILVLGMDSLATFSQWVRPDRIRELARFGVLTRTAVSKNALEKETGSELPDGATLVTARRIDVSSSEIRERIRAGKSIKGFVAESVEEFIRSAQLYTS
ncbi:MAG TPA: nicotinate-nucleotide adenylyltransferase [Gemmatimonadaceae bacterium]|nr:nicotinate-nucleotide adenylyltransferase [Gemmatimonadaceae bacterium]